MNFTLTYDGPLGGSPTRSPAKHDIRRALHPQLKAVWEAPPFVHRKDVVDPSAPTDKGGGAFLTTVGGRTFGTLVHDKYHLRANIKILMLRRSAVGGLIHGGDVDNRLKTLFDAMQRPQTEQEIPSAWTPAADETPLFCLLDDDRLVTRVDVDTAQWYQPGDPKDVRLLITVEIWTPSTTYWSLGIL